jgi:hypothetical protein
MEIKGENVVVDLQWSWSQGTKTTSHALIGANPLISGQWALPPALISRAREPKFTVLRGNTQNRGHDPLRCRSGGMHHCRTRRRPSSSMSAPPSVNVLLQALRYGLFHPLPELWLKIYKQSMSRVITR